MLKKTNETQKMYTDTTIIRCCWAIISIRIWYREIGNSKIRFQEFRLVEIEVIELISLLLQTDHNEL